MTRQPTGLVDTQQKAGVSEIPASQKEVLTLPVNVPPPTVAYLHSDYLCTLICFPVRVRINCLKTAEFPGRIDSSFGL